MFPRSTKSPPQCDVMINADGTATLDMNAMPAPTAREAGSIITEAAPSEVGSEFSETRIQAEQAAAAAASGSGLPLIGSMPAARQQRILAWLIGHRTGRPRLR